MGKGDIKLTDLNLCKEAPHVCQERRLHDAPPPLEAPLLPEAGSCTPPLVLLVVGLGGLLALVLSMFALSRTLRARLSTADAERIRLREVRDRLQAQLDDLEAELTRCSADRARLMRETQEAERERTRLRAQLDLAAEERTNLLAELATTTEELARVTQTDVQKMDMQEGGESDSASDSSPSSGTCGDGDPALLPMPPTRV
jgi:hypothetical protein